MDHGTRAIAETFFGAENKWGKLPITIYNANYTKELDAADAGISNYEFAKGPGRGYRYYKGVPLYPFGHGLSYTTFTHKCAKQGDLGFDCVISNTGSVTGDEVLMVFHSVGEVMRGKPSAIALTLTLIIDWRPSVLSTTRATRSLSRTWSAFRGSPLRPRPLSQ